MTLLMTTVMRKIKHRLADWNAPRSQGGQALPPAAAAANHSMAAVKRLIGLETVLNKLVNT